MVVGLSIYGIVILNKLIDELACINISRSNFLILYNSNGIAIGIYIRKRTLTRESCNNYRIIC